MIYSDVSCDVEKTLDKVKQINLRELLEVDYFSLVTASNHGSLSIDGDIFYNELSEDSSDNKRYLNFLEENKKKLFNKREPKIENIKLNDKWYSLLIVPIRAQENYIVYSVTIKEDIIYKKRDLSIMSYISEVSYENTLLDNEIVKERNLLENIFESVDSFIITIGLEGVIISANRGVYDTLGIKPDKIIGKNIEELTEDKDYRLIKRIINNFIKNKSSKTVQEEIVINSKTGRIPIDLIIAPVHNNKNHVIGIVLIGTDATIRKINSKEIEQLSHFALTGELATGIAHDIRNPLMIIRGCARILEKKMAQIDGADEFVEPIILEVDRIDMILKHMLSYNYITKEANYSLFDINETIETCINVGNLHKRSKNISIEKELESNLPLLEGNNVQIQQALFNIILNSIQSVEKDGKIIIRSLNDKKYSRIEIEIEDTGSGIKSEEIKKIFNPLYTSKTTGSGFGLPIAKRAIDKLNGSIMVESLLGRGTKFIIYLPY